MRSPCVRVCRLSPDGGVCVGCWRTLAEITHWGMLDPDQRRAVLDLLPARQREAQRRGGWRVGLRGLFRPGD